VSPWVQSKPSQKKKGKREVIKLFATHIAEKYLYSQYTKNYKSTIQE
jgi:hypothetical protein